MLIQISRAPHRHCPPSWRLPQCSAPCTRPKCSPHIDETTMLPSALVCTKYRTVKTVFCISHSSKMLSKYCGNHNSSQYSTVYPAILQLYKYNFHTYSRLKVIFRFTVTIKHQHFVPGRYTVCSRISSPLFSLPSGLTCQMHYITAQYGTVFLCSKSKSAFPKFFQWVFFRYCHAQSISLTL